ncbi:hypothetical protein BU24DRAFT_421812 [Aaosphaeria arxii CBS 175.79]|uniref:Uncharacterized protein n=1 Tax=Aaosphaeria arxii CBS 175.79 TaxID=1450172 RepID=A0A6A5XRP0_9PLEO|nr:uncharacterized protein BU24DRAFT_421812 [Aaosphaeria arxii CBS 175.79]KAF2015507.1 hypothetical protein BU24DRAFT_421812 [Aaosphaeria arxii CBS 175.79]
MASAVDIITYVGIPLAVLGVLPTIYVCLKSYFTLREITKTLHRNGVIAITRSALLTGIVEIEIPRRSIIPLDRNDPNYFGLNPKSSSLKGGSWTLFNWKEMVIGVKSYRLQYHDELAQPQAEIDFEALVAFLLDRGAVPSKDGWADLRSAGLWTPVGTKLLLSPISAEEVLSVAMSDDSDGIVSLSLNWKKEWDKRSQDSLPPYWIRLNPPSKDVNVLAALQALEDDPDGKDPKEVDERGGFLDDASAVSDGLESRSSVRMKISATGIQEAYDEDDAKMKLPLFHLGSGPVTDSTAGFWFCCAATAYEVPQGGLWSFRIPDEIVAIARGESVPGGVMVLIGAMTDEEVPTWRTKSVFDVKAEGFERHVKFVEQSRRVAEEMRMPPEQREEARRKRMQQEAADFHNDFRRRQMKEEQRKEAEVVEAMQSRKLPISIIAEANRKWLLRTLHLSEEASSALLLEPILYAMVRNDSLSRRISVMLDLWRNWSQSGGMTRSHFLAVKEDQVAFSLASLLLLAVRSTMTDPIGSIVGDLQECLRMWKKVRLG